jgi:CheY-like chemotaxis protein
MYGDYKYKTVMLIDDNFIDNAINQKILESNLFAKRIIAFESAQHAADYLQENLLQHDTLPEVIFLDLRMPEVDGYAFLEQLEKIPAFPLHEVKIYVLSSSLDPTDRKKIKKNPLTEIFISKPLTEQILNNL